MQRFLDQLSRASAGLVLGALVALTLAGCGVFEGLRQTNVPTPNPTNRVLFPNP